ATLDDAVSSLADYITSHDLNGVTLLGFSLGGVMVTQAAPLVADRLARVVFHSAVVLRTGESVFDTVPPKMGQHLRSLTNKGMLTMPHAMFRDRIAAEEDAATAQALYDTHSYPHAVSMFDTSVDARAFENLLAEGLPVSWVEAPNDVLLGFGRWRWSRFANRLGTPRVIHLPACGHDAPLTHPEATAYAYHKAARA
ncbi:MAG: alpha/beta fold hydrolase, partial [Stackebrandtia sp.]